MDLKEFIINLYRKGYSISYIEKLVYKKKSKLYIYEIFKSNKKGQKFECRKFIEDTILEYLNFNNHFELYS